MKCKTVVGVNARGLDTLYKMLESKLDDSGSTNAVFSCVKADNVRCLAFLLVGWSRGGEGRRSTLMVTLEHVEPNDPLITTPRAIFASPIGTHGNPPFASKHRCTLCGAECEERPKCLAR